MIQKHWDVFISYAVEDRDVAAPLARKLEDRGIRVWFDQGQVELADGLRRKVNDGISRSRFAVTLLSPRYFEKKWTTDELDAFMAQEDGVTRTVLPVLHGIDIATVATHYPLLTDRMFCRTSGGLDSVADEIVQAVLKQGSDSPSQLSPTLGRRFLTLLDEGHDLVKLRQFVSHHPAITLAAIGGGPKSIVRVSPNIGGFTPDLCASVFQPTLGRHAWRIIVLGTSSRELFDAKGELVCSLRHTLEALESLRTWIPANYEAARSVLPGVTADFQAFVVAGRRTGMASEDRKKLEELTDALMGISLRTYDWLVDAALTL